MEIHGGQSPKNDDEASASIGKGNNDNGTTGRGKPGGGKGGGKKPGGPNSNGAVPVDWEALARSTAHPLRIAILEAMSREGGRTLSPSDLCRELQVPLSNTNYHVTELAKSGLIELTGTRQVRGATEHFYRLRRSSLESRSTRR